MKVPNRVCLTNVTKIIRKKTLVDRVNFEVHEGEIIGLLGPNGAGKTTLMKMMLGLSKITSGAIEINGKNIATQFEEAMSQVGAIIEVPRFYKHLSGYKNLLLHVHHHANVDRTYIEEIIIMVGMEENMKKKVKHYSLGMNQRLGLAVALLNQPSLLILDEPTNGLDAAGVQELRTILKNLALEKGVSIIISSHALGDMESLCDRVVFINRGKILSIESMNELFQMEETRYQIELKDANKLPALAHILTEKGVSIVYQEHKTIIAKLSPMQISKILNECAALCVDIVAAIPMKENLEEKYLKIVGR